LAPARFEAFHRDNPHVYVKLRELARTVARTRRRIGIAALFERLRWWAAFETVDVPPFKLNNDYRAYYARLLMQEPELAGLFATRASRADTQETP
jgi:hypothetical protein